MNTYHVSNNILPTLLPEHLFAFLVKEMHGYGHLVAGACWVLWWLMGAYMAWEMWDK